MSKSKQLKESARTLGSTRVSRVPTGVAPVVFYLTTITLRPIVKTP